MASAALATTSVTKRSNLAKFGVFGHFGGTPPKTPKLTILAIFDHFGPPPPGGVSIKDPCQAPCQDSDLSPTASLAFRIPTALPIVVASILARSTYV
jgi:hypothetical protein